MGSIFGGGKDPSVDYSTSETETEAKKAKANRSALLMTKGGIQGEELSSEEVKKRETLLGN